MKIKPEELRIGNLVHCTETDSEWTVNDIFLSGSAEDMGYYIGLSDGYRYTPDQLEPIALTEELLERLGYMEYAPGKYDRDDFWTISTWQGKSKQIFWIKDLDVELEFVHQLQNLYASTNFKELKPSNEKEV